MESPEEYAGLAQNQLDLAAEESDLLRSGHHQDRAIAYATLAVASSLEETRKDADFRWQKSIS